jgi:hypothetical protein
MNPTRSVLLSIGCAVLFTAAPLVARAQETSAPRDSESSCLMSIPDSALRPVAVYVQAELVDSTERSILPGIDLLTQEVADSVRSSLGAAEDQLPSGEPAVTWRALDATLEAVVYRDGRFSSAVHQSEDSNRADTTAAHLLARALAAVTANGGYFMIWPDGFEADSVAFRLAMHHPLVNGQGIVGTLSLRRAFALFSARVPTEEPVEVRRRVRPRYPEDLPEKGVSGNVIMQFIVDTTGRAEMATVKDLWPTSRPRLTGDKGKYYEDFRRSVIQSIARDRFEPARIGGCKVRQLVQMPFGFRLRR